MLISPVLFPMCEHMFSEWMNEVIFDSSFADEFTIFDHSHTAPKRLEKHIIMMAVC